ncbi:MAG: ATP-dependent Clp protease ATP-binding subunit [Candidatus Margulisiibacteriota bacterium]
MFSRFSEKAIQVIMTAQQEAKALGHEFVGTEHILLGIMKEKDSIANEVFKRLNITEDTVRKAVQNFIKHKPRVKDPGNIVFTPQTKKVLSAAWDEARQLGHTFVNVEHLLLALTKDEHSTASQVFSSLSITPQTIKETVFKILEAEIVTPEEEFEMPFESNTPELDNYSRDLTRLAVENKLDPVIGRAKEIERIIQILSRRTKNNPVLTGDAGVGKTAIIEGLAQKIIAKQVPDMLKNKRVVTLDLGLLVAGTKFRGEFEERVKGLMEEIRTNTNVILFIDELHTIIGTGGSEGSLDAANMFKPALARGEIQCIGATTLQEYRKYIEGDAALERRFQSILVEEPTIEETIEILRGIKTRYEDYHKVTITDEAVEAAAKLSARYISDRHLPDKAIDLIDEAASRVIVKKREDKTVSAETIAEIVSSWTGVPILQLTDEELHRLQTMSQEIGKKIIGQEKAIDSLARAIKRGKAGLKDPQRPIGSFMFLGPSGVGKTELAKVLAEFLFGSAEALQRFDMSEYTEKHTTSRLVGSPPGYVGHKEGGQLTDAVRKKPYSVVLFDEVEKASPEVLTLLLQIMEDGRLTDAVGRTVNFKNTVILMTSNCGARDIQSSAGYGFVAETRKDEVDYEKMKAKVLESLKKDFVPEFLNRIDDVIVFRALNKENIEKIAMLMINDVNSRLFEGGLSVKVGPSAIKFLTNKGFDPKHGARPLRRVIQEFIEDRLSDKLLEKPYLPGTEFTANVKGDDIFLTAKGSSEKEPPKGPTKESPKESSPSYANN